jgi:hypothetical protein
MLALPLALLLALPAPTGSTAGTPSVNEPSLPPISILPYGTAQGSWFAAEFREDGALVAMLFDPAGNPAYHLEARLTSAGMIYGELHPALAGPGYGLLKVVGQAQLPLEDGSRFAASIFSPLEGPIPVHPFGALEGVLLLRDRRSLVAGAGDAEPAAAVDAAFTPRPVVIVCPAARSAGVGGATSLGNLAPAQGHALRPVVVGPPQVPGITLAGQTQVSAQTAAFAAPVVPTLPPSWDGTLRARWYLLP